MKKLLKWRPLTGGVAVRVRARSLAQATGLLLASLLLSQSRMSSPTAGESPSPAKQLSTVIALPSGEASSPPTFSSSELNERPLAELSAEAQGFLEGREDRWGVAVVVPSRERIYTDNGDQLMSMASPEDCQQESSGSDAGQGRYQSVHGSL